MRRDTLLDFFNDLASYSGEFLIHDDGLRVRRYSYADTGRAARAFAARLQRNGIAKGDKVLIWSENRPEWIAALWGCLLNGTVIVPIDYRSSFEFLERVQEQVRARAILTGDEVAWTGRGIEAARWNLADFDWTETSVPVPVEVTRQDLAEIIFTSGATAEPKGVLIEHRNILANIVPVESEVRKYRKWGKPFHPIRFLNLLPLSHMFGQAMATFIPPMLPGTAIFLRGYNPVEIARQIKSHRVSVLVCVPKILEILREHVLARFPEAAAAASGSGEHWLRRWWRFRRIHRMFGWKFWAFITGAAPLPPELEEFWSRLGFVVIQGYGLTETAPIVTLNHPFHMSKGTVGKPIGGVEVKIASDGEVLVRGENVTPGYYGGNGTAFDSEGWFHTGDAGEIASDGSLLIRGRKKEMIVTPEGLNVFPEDVERVLDRIPGVRESAVTGRDRVHAVLVLEPGAGERDVVRQANAQLQDHQKIRAVTVWPGTELPRTEGTRKLRRGEIARVIESGATAAPANHDISLPPALARLAAGRELRADTTLEELGLSSLERVELMMELGVKEGELAPSRTVRELIENRDSAAPAPPQETFEFPKWNRSVPARWVRNFSLETWILPIGRLFAWVRAEGRENLAGISGPVIFAPNHQSHFDVPAILMALPWRWRFRVAPAMSMEFFDAHFHPERHSFGERFTNSLNYYLSALFFNTFPLPQRERSAIEALRYAGDLAGDGWSILIFPEGIRTQHGEIRAFRLGVAMMAARLGIPVVPVRFEGLDRILHSTWRMARPGRARVKFGAPLRFTGDNYAAIAQRIEDAVKSL
jgi:long-chain acyl-CoA synthetase